MRGGIFISYRGIDSHSYAALLYVELSRGFSSGRVFLDSVSIPAGADYVEHLLAQVRRCTVLLVVIGPSWLTAADPHGHRLIDDPRDWIRRELAEAFALGVRVIPVLTDGASLPSEAQLPADIAALGRCQYRLLRLRDVTADLERLRRDLATTHPVVVWAARLPTTLIQRLPVRLPRSVQLDPELRKSTT